MNQRALERIENSLGSDLVCNVEGEGFEFECDVADFNALGFQLACRDRRQYMALIQGRVIRAQVLYGDYLLGTLTVPKVIRATAKTKKVVLIPSPRSTIQIVERPRRAPVPYLLEPMIVGPDPIQVRERIIFRVFNISENGFRAKCSLSNRHLCPGLRMAGFTIYLPMMGSFDCSFTIANVRVDGEYLNVGCIFGEPNRRLGRMLRDFMLLCLFAGSDEGAKISGERLPKKLSSLVRIRRINSKEMDKVLELRLRAYKAANKVASDTTDAAMLDEFDKNSIVLGAFVGHEIAGTVRAVFSRDGSSFPFEKYFPFPEGDRFRRFLCAEISRLAIEPSLQGSDLVFRLMQAAVLEFVPKTEFAFLIATDDLAKNYLLMGAERLAGPVPHPVAPDRQMSLYVLSVAKMKSGRMSALAWIFFMREIIDFMSRFGFTRKTSIPVIDYLIMTLALGIKKVKKMFFGWRRSR